MRCKNSQLIKKHIYIKDQKFLVHENDITHHNMEKKQYEYVFIDMSIMSLGRIASIVANVINNKYDIDYSGHIKNIYKIVLYNCDQHILTGDKTHTKKYVKHTGYPGGIKEIIFGTLYEKNIRTCFEQVISRMLNKNRSRQKFLNNIIYEAGTLPSNMNKKQTIVQNTVDNIMNEWISKKEKKNAKN